jgi:CBS domain containing-hemolysin-like protein
MAQLGTEEGVLDRLEGSVIRNVIGLDQLTPHDIMTPRVVVFRLDESMGVGEVSETISSWEHSRVPLYVEHDPDMVTHYILQRDIYRALVQGEEQRLLKEFARELKVIPEFVRIDKLLVEMFRDGEHICSVIDEHGGFAGLVTLEDIIEEVVGREIVDEYDKVRDLRSYAKTLHTQKQKVRESEEGD